MQARLAAAFVALSLLGASALNVKQDCQDGRPKSKGQNDEPANSKVIPGPDCGHVKMIVGKWNRAAKVGEAAGNAQGAIIEADKAAGLATKAAEASAKVIKKYGDGASTDAADAAKGAAKAATKASTAAESTLGTVKDAIKAGDFAGQEVKPSDLSKLQDDTEEAIKAAKKADEKAARALAFAADVKKTAMKDLEKAVQIVGEVADAAKPALEKATEYTQKAKHAGKDAKAQLDKLEDTAKDLDKKIEKANEQAPVGESLKESLEAHKGPLQDLRGATDDASKEVDKASKDLEGLLEPIVAAAEGAMGGDPAISSMSEDVTKAEGGLKTLQDKMEDLMSKVTKMKKEESRLKVSIEKADKWDSGY